MTTTQFKSINEAPRGYTYRFAITADDLTETTDNTAQTIALITLPTGTVIQAAATYLKTPFADASDSALNATTLIVGDSGNDDRCIASQELNVNGTEVLAQAQASTLPYATVASTTVNAIFGSMAAKDLASVDVGEVHIFLKVADLTTLG